MREGPSMPETRLDLGYSFGLAFGLDRLEPDIPALFVIDDTIHCLMMRHKGVGIHDGCVGVAMHEGFRAVARQLNADPARHRPSAQVIGCVWVILEPFHFAACLSEGTLAVLLGLLAVVQDHNVLTLSTLPAGIDPD